MAVKLKMDNLPSPYGSRKTVKRLGRGMGSGLGKTSGKGHKGQKARAGSSKGVKFEGGQTPIVRRKPKFATFSNFLFKKRYTPVNLATIDMICEDGDVVDIEFLMQRGIVKKRLDGVKILGVGAFTHKGVKIKAAGFSKSALEKIKLSGSEAEVE